jgi:hypothetical protein
MIIRLAIEDSKALEQIRARYTPAAAPTSQTKSAQIPAETKRSVEKRIDPLPEAAPRAVSTLQSPETNRPYARAG